MQPSNDNTARTDRSFLACPGCGGLRWHVKDVQEPARQNPLVVAYACQDCHTTVRMQYSHAEQAWTVAIEQREPGGEKPFPAMSAGSSTASPLTMT